MGTTRTERAKDPGGCGGEDRGLWGSGGRLSPHNRASSSGDSRLSRGDRSGSDRHGRSGGRRDKEGAYRQRLRRGFPARTLPRVGGARGVRPLSRTLRTVLYSPECLEKLFGNSEWVPNRGYESGQKGSKECRSAASWRQRSALETPSAIFQTVSEEEFSEVPQLLL